MATFCRLDFTYAYLYVSQCGHIYTVSNRACKFRACFHLEFPLSVFHNSGVSWTLPYFALYRKVIRDEGCCLCESVHS
jgi:hypothetical protein